ncbi:Nin one binding Zn-ribbon like-domain-containing protein [Fimicolochytrium jonesii]|uniref:Nin one binding Zn-ribbon like-domain-containing protein n=1 Tax=Fimicolochytrium jonesii TaxID=1396493 RepID=UPI0022FF3BDC|nr:Nin one binding Zn-ribbon like-domain-containing protein [Fimicolochytrium jonesii]KAI8816098.1 Nin one binding Zn-ribbon like-domain-containing protein [Fimicolochytrium jonesii]
MAATTTTTAEPVGLAAAGEVRDVTLEAPTSNAAAPSKDLNGLTTGQDKVVTLVVDSAPLIKGTPLFHLAERFVTIPEVLAEIRDKRARQGLTTLPFDLETRVPSEEAVAAVVAFSKKTGDFASLSVTDMKVLALTWMLEKEARGTAHLRTEPASDLKKKVQQKQQQERAKVVEKVKAEEQKSAEILEAQQRLAEMSLQSREGDGDAKEEVDGDDDEGAWEQPQAVGDEVEETSDEEDEEAEEETQQAAADNDDNEGWTTATRRSRRHHDALPDLGDEEGWITPNNIKKIKQSDATGSSKKNKRRRNRKKAPQVLPVACISADFAMQNVLLQMGLKLLSVDGVVIDRVKNFVLRCHACYKVTTDMEKKFCPSCGNSSLIRTTVGVDARTGEVTYYLKKNFQYNTRGTKYNIPPPKGGRRNNDMLLREDQREYQRAANFARRRAAKEAAAASSDVFSPDFTTGSLLMGGAADTNKFGNFQSGAMPVIGHGRKNVNEVRGKGKKRR